jgi:hypothetical protein
MSDWNRGTLWRQGHLLDEDAVNGLSLSSPELKGRTAALIVSHDCDLVQPTHNEPFVEVIVGCFIEVLDGNFTFAKNVRRLHLRCSGGSKAVALELSAAKKQQIAKERLLASKPRPDLRLSRQELAILQTWLAARYRRAAFPDEFDRRFNQETGLRNRLGKILEIHGIDVPAVFFDVDDGEEVNHDGINDPYKLVIYLLYSTQNDPQAAEVSANEAKKLIEAAFKEKCGQNGEAWQWIELCGCEIYADTAMSYYQSTILKKWQADHISLRSDPPQAMLEN